MKNDTPETPEKSGKPIEQGLPRPVTAGQPMPPAGKIQKNPSTKSGRAGKLFAASLLLIILCFLAGLGGGLLSGGNNSPLTLIDRNSGDGNKVVTQEEEDISGVASKVGPSVVSIVTKAQAQSLYGTRTQEGAGTGIIVSADGYVLTNKHVVEGSQTVSVVTSDGTSYEDVRVVGTDPLNDVAFLKISSIQYFSLLRLHEGL